MRQPTLAPSILAADFTVLGQEIRDTEENGAEYLHFDVMDGVFVPSISFGMPVLASIKPHTGQVMDVHLMVTEPVRYIGDFVKAGADIITVHMEACKDAGATLGAIRESGVKAGLSIKPDTPAESIRPYLDRIDMVLVMSVEPGFGGQKFLPGSLEKIRAIRAMIEETQAAADLEVDGGLYQSNVEEVLEAGANVIVSGSGVFKGDTARNTREFMKILRKER